MQIRNVCGICQSKSIKPKYIFDNYSVVECGKCYSIFRDRILSPKEDEALYGKDYFLNLQKDYFSDCLVPNPKDKSRLNDFNKRLDLLTKFLKRPDKIKLLDVGAGTGAFAYLAQKRGWQTLSIEISKFAAKIARTKFKVKVYRGEITDASFKKGDKYDVITLWESIANIEDTSRLLRKTSRLLNKDGKVAVLTTVVDSWLFYIARLIYFLSFKKINYFVKEGYPIHHSNHFTRKNLERIFNMNGLRVIYKENYEIPYKYTKLPRLFFPFLIVFGQFAKMSDTTIQVLMIAQKKNNL